MRAYFTPRLIGAHVLALVLVAVAVGLGLWQLNAWQAQREAEVRDLTHLDPVPVSDLIGPDDPFPGLQVGRPVFVEGAWLPEATVYVSGRADNGTDGFWVVTPLTVGDPTDPALPIVRGWTLDPEQAPAAPTGTAQVTAWLQPAEGTGATDDDPTDDVLPQLRIADLIQHVDQDLYGAYAVLDQAAESTNAGATDLAQADLDQLPDAKRFTALRNFLYAVEWWFFGAFAAFIWWRYVRDEVAAQTATEAARADEVTSEA